MAIGLFQPINAFLRPHAPSAGLPKEPLRLAWEILHKAIGYGITLVAIINIFLGMKENRKLGNHSNWYVAAYGGYLGGLSSLYIGLMIKGFKRKRHCGAKGEEASGSK